MTRTLAITQGTSSETSTVVAAAGPLASGSRSKLWRSLADVLGLVPDPPSGFIQSSHWAAYDDVGHIGVPRASADGSPRPARGLGAAAPADLRRTQSQGVAETAVRAATGEDMDSASDAAVARAIPLSGAMVAMAASVADVETGPCSHQQRSSSLALTLQRAASAASYLWRGDSKDGSSGDSKGGSSGDNSPSGPAAGPRSDGATAAASEPRSSSKAEATITSAVQSRCHCPQHRAKAAAAAAAAALKTATTSPTEADPASKAAQVAAGSADAGSQPAAREQPQEHLPLSFPVPWLAQQPERAAALENADASVLGIAKASCYSCSLSGLIPSHVSDMRTSLIASTHCVDCALLPCLCTIVACGLLTY